MPHHPLHEDENGSSGFPLQRTGAFTRPMNHDLEMHADAAGNVRNEMVFRQVGSCSHIPPPVCSFCERSVSVSSKVLDIFFGRRTNTSVANTGVNVRHSLPPRCWMRERQVDGIIFPDVA